MDLTIINKVIIEFQVDYERIIKNHNKYNIVHEITNGIADSMTIEEIYDFIANTCASYIYKNYDFNVLANKYVMNKLYIQTNNKYIDCVKKQYELQLVSEKFYSFVKTNIDFLDSILCYDRDYNIDFFGLKTLERSYLLKDKKERILELPQHLFLRTSIQVHGLNIPDTNILDTNISDTNYIALIKETYDYMSRLYFTHATPTLFNSGSSYPQLSSCYLMQCPDDLLKISQTMSNIMMISKWAGGIGVNLSDIRSNESLITKTGGLSQGIIPLCKVLESIARYVNQGGRRTGSIACFIEPWHYDIVDFCELRKNTGDENLRTRDLFLGLWVCDSFMRAVENDDDWYLMSPNECPNLTSTTGEDFDKLYYSYVSDGKFRKKIKAVDLYQKILESQLETGMPYMMYKDAVNKKSNQQNLGVIKNSNLCSEICEFSSEDEIAVCNLASICLPKFVTNIGNIPSFDFVELGKVVQIVTNNLNKIIDVNFYPVKETMTSNMKHRPIGIGIQGLADTYIKLNYSFESTDAKNLNKKIFECIYYNSLSKSNKLAQKFGHYSSFKGSPFSQGKFQFDLWGIKSSSFDIANNPSNPSNPSNISYPSYDWDLLAESVKLYGTRNSLLTTIMPTASTAQIMNNNESIEPYTTNLYVRKTLAGEYIIVNKYLMTELDNLGLWNEDIYNELIYDNGSVQKLDIPDYLKQKYKTAYEIKQSAIIQQSADRGIFIDHSQSLNLFMEIPDFDKLHSCHMFSWKKGLKTGMYYLRTRPAIDAVKFGIDPTTIKKIKQKRNESYESVTQTVINDQVNQSNQSNQTNQSNQSNQACSRKREGDTICIVCSS
jgi:ribonucleoside-diphosphate reductase alpha chain